SWQRAHISEARCGAPGFVIPTHADDGAVGMNGAPGSMAVRKQIPFGNDNQKGKGKGKTN
ncbi:MAG TPA: hypothetical protein VIJ65_04115, partial [Acidobacteriaceae bacterium]